MSLKVIKLNADKELGEALKEGQTQFEQNHPEPATILDGGDLFGAEQEVAKAVRKLLLAAVEADRYRNRNTFLGIPERLEELAKAVGTECGLRQKLEAKIQAVRSEVTKEHSVAIEALYSKLWEKEEQILELNHRLEMSEARIETWSEILADFIANQSTQKKPNWIARLLRIG